MRGVPWGSRSGSISRQNSTACVHGIGNEGRSLCNLSEIICHMEGN